MRPRRSSCARARVRVGGHRCAVGRATPLSALAGTRLRIRLRDYGSCSRSPADAGALYVAQVGPDRRGGRAVGSTRSAVVPGPPAPPTRRARSAPGGCGAGERLLWFWCVQDRAGRLPADAGGAARALDGRARRAAARDRARLRRQWPRRAGRRRARAPRRRAGADRRGRRAEVTAPAAPGRLRLTRGARRHGALVPGAGGRRVRPRPASCSSLRARARRLRLGAGDAPSGAGTQLTVSRDFGADEMGTSKQAKIPRARR